MIQAVDLALARLPGAPSPELAAIFDGFDPATYEVEAAQRWGDTEAFAESQRRTKDYSPQEWDAIKAESDAILRRVAAAIEIGTAPETDDGRALAEAYRLHVDRYYYPCSRGMYREVASMYVSDPRFRNNLDRFGDGVAAFLTTAAEANAG